MRAYKEGALLRVHTIETARHEGHPLHEAIVMKAKEAGLKGATVSRGILGFGHDHRVHTAKILDLSFELPLIIEIIDEEERIKAFLPILDTMIQGGTVYWTPIRMLDT